MPPGPGGYQLWPRSGYWSPDGVTPNVVQCNFPAADRCAGWDAANDTVVCGTGFDHGTPACGGCSQGYYPDPNGCWPCPVKATEKYARIVAAGVVIVAVVVGSLVAVAVVMKVRQGKVDTAVAMYRAVRTRGSGRGCT